MAGIFINYSGYREGSGSFNCDVYIDETKQDYEIEYGDGTIGKQISPFQNVITDWNHDGDVYGQFGAWFQSPFGGNTFLSVVDMVSIAAQALDKDHRCYANEIKNVRGVDIPLSHRRPGLDETIQKNEVRSANMEAERNRRMNALGIRSPGEPWAR